MDFSSGTFSIQDMTICMTLFWNLRLSWSTWKTAAHLSKSNKEIIPNRKSLSHPQSWHRSIVWLIDHSSSNHNNTFATPYDQIIRGIQTIISVNRFSQICIWFFNWKDSRRKSRQTLRTCTDQWKLLRRYDQAIDRTANDPVPSSPRPVPSPLLQKDRLLTRPMSQSEIHDGREEERKQMRYLGIIWCLTSKTNWTEKGISDYASLKTKNETLNDESMTHFPYPKKTRPLSLFKWPIDWNQMLPIRIEQFPSRAKEYDAHDKESTSFIQAHMNPILHTSSIQTEMTMIVLLTHRPRRIGSHSQTARKRNLILDLIWEAIRRTILHSFIKLVSVSPIPQVHPILRLTWRTSFFYKHILSNYYWVIPN